MTRAVRLSLLLALLLLPFGAARAAETVVITLWTWRPEASLVAEMVAAIRHAHPDIDLRAVVQPGATYFPALRQAAASGTLPDIIGLPAGSAMQRLRGSLEDLSTPADGIFGTDWRKHFPKELLDEAALGNPPGDDTLYLLPMTAQVRSLWLDRAAFEQAGLSGAPPTLDAMGEGAAKLRAAHLTPLALAGRSDRALIGLFLEIVAQTDATELQAAEGGQPVWTHPGMLRAAGSWQRLFSKVVGKDALLTDAAAARAAFAQAHAGMSAEGSDWLGRMRSAENPDAELAKVRGVQLSGNRERRPAEPAPRRHRRRLGGHAQRLRDRGSGTRRPYCAA